MYEKLTDVVENSKGDIFLIFRIYCIVNVFFIWFILKIIKSYIVSYFLNISNTQKITLINDLLLK